MSKLSELDLELLEPTTIQGTIAKVMLHYNRMETTHRERMEAIQRSKNYDKKNPF